VWLPLPLLLSQKMGPQAHFANSSKCGVSRIASEPTSSRPIFPALLGKTDVRPAPVPSVENDRQRAERSTACRRATKRTGGVTPARLTVRPACLLENRLVRVLPEKDAGACRGVRIPRWAERATGLVERGDDEPVTTRGSWGGCWALSGTCERTRARATDDTCSGEPAKHESAHDRPPFPQPFG